MGGSSWVLRAFPVLTGRTGGRPCRPGPGPPPRCEILFCCEPHNAYDKSDLVPTHFTPWVGRRQWPWAASRQQSRTVTANGCTTDCNRKTIMSGARQTPAFSIKRLDARQSVEFVPMTRDRSGRDLKPRQRDFRIYYVIIKK